MAAKKKPIIIALVLLFIFYFIETWISNGSSTTYLEQDFDMSKVSLVDLGEDNISLTVPTFRSGPVQSQEDFDKVAAELGYSSIIYDEENYTLTYYITKDQQAEILSNYLEGARLKIASFPGNKPYDDISDIVVSDDLSSFDVYFSTSKADFDNSLIVSPLTLLAKEYYAYSGITNKDLHFNFYNNSKELIATLDSNVSTN